MRKLYCTRHIYPVEWALIQWLIERYFDQFLMASSPYSLQTYIPLAAFLSLFVQPHDAALALHSLYKH